MASIRVRPSSLGKYADRVERIVATLGDVRIGSLRPEQVATWQAATRPHSGGGPFLGGCRRS
jgi:hypothetical protein